MRQFQTLGEIVDNGFCIGCGLCKAIAPNAAIEMREAAHGHLRPAPTRLLEKDEEKAILGSCPGINVTGPFSADTKPGFDAIWGECRRIARGYAQDKALRFAASSGGIMTAINIHLLKTGRVNFILQAIPDPENPYGSLPAVCRTEEELLAANGSRYASAATLSSILDVLDLGEPFAVSLKPCDVAGVKNLQRKDARARDLIRFTQAMFCGTVPSISSLEGFYERRNLNYHKDRPTAFRWRGMGCPGPTVATMPDGSALEGTYNELWDENPWTTQFRCKLCPDAIGLQADIAVGDDWAGAVPVGEDEGWNALVAHTEIGLEVLNSCEAAAEIALYDADIEHLNNVQPHHVKMRTEMQSRLNACADEGLPVPKFEALDLAACSDRLTPNERKRARQGTAARLQRGQGDSDTMTDYGSFVG
ncbi:Coenzyme F420 hydrogenase/dehydrogenase, beta subunit C-terminal domain [Cochlodiniinecator piscidefendens]|uniref:Coenzyme F420 hydrogenase/dehydrogenase, beta subunit C-terminal domain n=1 Tax=Cochlodiniinecator piscidefendens TaxID=2715756 RepID=UPI00140ACCA1|nr:Coenzyme F420 hydrogenase/dehydrogenase, beta subunit C-terminal domain [Cochlodiniinecator piscidefendens]